MSKFKIWALFFALFIIWVIFAANTNSFPSLIRYLYNYPGGDKVGHLILYGILTFLMVLAFPYRHYWGWFSLGRVSIILFVLITLEELSQTFFSTRTFSILDLSFSFIGVLLGDFLAMFLQKKLSI